MYQIKRITFLFWQQKRCGCCFGRILRYEILNFLQNLFLQNSVDEEMGREIIL